MDGVWVFSNGFPKGIQNLEDAQRGPNMFNVEPCLHEGEGAGAAFALIAIRKAPTGSQHGAPGGEIPRVISNGEFVGDVEQGQHVEPQGEEGDKDEMLEEAADRFVDFMIEARVLVPSLSAITVHGSGMGVVVEVGGRMASWEMRHGGR